MIRLLQLDDLRASWPCDAAFIFDSRGLMAGWRGGVYWSSGRIVVDLKESCATLCAGRGLSGHEQGVWQAFLDGLAQCDTSRAALEHKSPAVPETAGIPNASNVSHDFKPQTLISNLGPAATRSLADYGQRTGRLERHFPHGYAWSPVARDLAASVSFAGAKSGATPIWLISNLIAGEVADWLASGGGAGANMVWAIHWPDALYVIFPGQQRHQGFIDAVERMEANLVSLDNGMQLMRANQNAAFVPACLPGPTHEQLDSLMSIVSAHAGDRQSVWRIAPSGISVSMDKPALAGASRNVLPPDAFSDRWLGIVKSCDQTGSLDTSGGAIALWRAVCGEPRHNLGRRDAIGESLAGFAADSDAEFGRLRAIMEAAERYAAIHWPARHWTRSSQQELMGDVLDVDSLPWYLPAQYSSSEFPLARFSKDQPKIWLPGKELSSGKALHVLSDLVLFPPVEGRSCVQATLSGTAAHTSWETACIAGLYELVERDALLMAWFKRAACPQISIASLTPPASDLVAALSSTGYTLHLIDVTTDLEVPVAMVIAESTRPEQPSLLVSGGAAATLDVAAQRALKEMAGMIIFHTQHGAGQKQNIPAAAYRHPTDQARLYYGTEARANWEFLIANPAVTSRTIEPAAAKLQPSDELASLVSRVTSKGSVVAVDRTPESVADAGTHVVSVVASGLQPLHFGPQLRRLRSPRLAEWPFSSALRTSGALDEHGLNPLPHPFN